MVSLAGRLENKVAIVTGGAMGLGEACARLFVEAGAKVAIADVNDAAGQKLAAELGDAAIFVHLDVSKEAEWTAAVNKTEAVFGPVTVLVNNAGIVAVKHLAEMTEADYRRVIDINQVGTFLGTKAVIASMRGAGGGSIVNVASCAGEFGMKHFAHYVSSKWAVRGFSRAASEDLAKYHIRVNVVIPGTMDTPMNAGLTPPKRQAIKRFARPEEVASMALYLASDEASYCTGRDYAVEGGFSNLVGEVMMDDVED
ncbi:3alpha(or 20beta)-hydroxysteroid dehydrogenase [Sphingobium faniae]|nr:3alpha(or 20beta)-hydroxysteroid dehydrogenase [Sphingobium faniae]